MSVQCDKEIYPEVLAFTMLRLNDETSQNLTNENLELLNKFSEFIHKDKGNHCHKGDKHMHHMHKHGHEHHGHKHGKFGRHGHHGMFGHFRKHGHHRHHHGHFGKHGHGKRNHEFEKHCEKPEKMNKYFWKYVAMSNSGAPCEDNTNRRCDNTESNTSSAAQGNCCRPRSVERPSTSNNAFVHSQRGRGRCLFKMIVRRNVDNSSQTETPEQSSQDNLTTMVDTITIDSPAKE